MGRKDEGGTPPASVDLRAAPLLFANAVKIEVREAMVWISLFVTSGDVRHVQGIILMTGADFAGALADANLAALLGGVTPSGIPAVAVH